MFYGFLRWQEVIIFRYIHKPCKIVKMNFQFLLQKSTNTDYYLFSWKRNMYSLILVNTMSSRQKIQQLLFLFAHLPQKGFCTKSPNFRHHVNKSCSPCAKWCWKFIPILMSKCDKVFSNNMYLYLIFLHIFKENIVV